MPGTSRPPALQQLRKTCQSPSSDQTRILTPVCAGWANLPQEQMKSHGQVFLAVQVTVEHMISFVWSSSGELLRFVSNLIQSLSLEGSNGRPKQTNKKTCKQG